MKELTKTENIVFLIGAIMMVVGSAANIFSFLWAPYLYTTGAIAFVLIQFKQGYKGTSSAIHRLRTIVIISDILFLLAGFLMFANNDNFLNLSAINHLQYIHNNWVIALLIASILQLYTSNRIGKELEKETKKK